MQRINSTLFVIAFAIALFSPAALHAATPACDTPKDVLLVLDKSGSMQNIWNDASGALIKIVANYQSKHRFGLLLFPQTRCEVKTIAVPIGMPNQQQAIANTLKVVIPDGSTPLVQALTVASQYLNGLTSTAPKAVILITDGVETCDVNGDPAAAAAALLKQGIETYVIAIDISSVQLDDIAKAGGTNKAGTIGKGQPIGEGLTKKLSEVLEPCCGNGSIDSGEICDTAIEAGKPGACPSLCDDGDRCTADYVSCRSGCVYQPIEAIVEDGCCPKSPFSESDPDCQKLCGNGKLDGHERCDTAIKVGQAGACNCDDQDPCTDDAVRGCYTDCWHRRRDPSLIEDGCCPDPSLRANVDVDCPAVSANADAGPPRDGGSGVEPRHQGGCAISATAAGGPTIGLLFSLLAWLRRRRR